MREGEWGGGRVGRRGGREEGDRWEGMGEGGDRRVGRMKKARGPGSVHVHACVTTCTRMCNYMYTHV